MSNHRTPTDEELEELKRMSRQEALPVARRAQMVMLWTQQYGVGQIAIICGFKRDTVRKWLRAFDAHGPAGLYGRVRS